MQVIMHFWLFWCYGHEFDSVFVRNTLKKVVVITVHKFSYLKRRFENIDV